MAKESFSLPLLPVIIVGIVSFTVGALAMYLVSMKATTKPMAPAPMSSTSVNDFFDGVTSTVQGTVTEVSQDMITVKNKKDMTQSFKLHPSVYVSKPGQNGKVATASGEVSAIEKGKEVVMSFGLKDGEYVVMSVIQPIMPQKQPSAPKAE